LGVFDKPHSLGTPEFDKYAKDLIRKVKIFSGVSVVKRRRTRIKSNALRNHSLQKTELKEKNIKLVAIGSSTGGPQVLKEIFQFIRKDFPLPIVVVQHIAKNFCEPMVIWLNELSPLEIKLAEQNETLKPGKIYFAPDEYHLEITKNLTAALIDSPPVHSSKPSVSILFHSVSSNVIPAVGILLTGMGLDGAAELKKMKDSGSVTIAQNEDSCIVYGMPMEAVKLGGASYSLSPTEIIEYLNKLGDKIYEA
jgi:two-component system chemotaxis response regulator CheB